MKKGRLLYVEGRLHWSSWQAADGSQRRGCEVRVGIELLLTLCKAREELGRWPTAGEWEFANREHVSRRSYTREFGSWHRACLTAARLLR